MPSKSKKIIAIYFWESWLSVSPTIINLAEAFSQKGHQVIIFMRNIKLNYAPDTQLEKNITVVKLSPLLSFTNKHVLKLSKLFPKQYRSLLKNKMVFKSICLQTRQYLLRYNKLNLLHIGVDATGLYWAFKSSGRHDKLIYLSLELLCKKDIAHQDLYTRLIKAKETSIHKSNILATLIQDKYRLNVLHRENKISTQKACFILTNSPRESASKHVDKNYFKNLFKLPEDGKIILMAGIIDKITMAAEISERFGRIKNDKLNLVFHERESRSPEEPFLKRIACAGGKNVHLSLNPLPYSEIHKVYSSCDVGLAFYNSELGDNITHIIGASGKLSHYLMYGIPVIANDLPGFKELFTQYNIGVVIKKMDQLENAINIILSKYKMYSSNAYNCYLKEYNFDAQFNQFYNACYNHFN